MDAKELLTKAIQDLEAMSSEEVQERTRKAGIVFPKSLREIAIETVGYTTIALDGWVVRDYGDGRIERISKIEKAKRPKKLKLD